MKKKYESEEWFSAKFLHEFLSVKDALRTSTAALLEKHLVIHSCYDLPLSLVHFMSLQIIHLKECSSFPNPF